MKIDISEEQLHVVINSLTHTIECNELANRENSPTLQKMFQKDMDEDQNTLDAFIKYSMPEFNKQLKRDTLRFKDLDIS